MTTNLPLEAESILQQLNPPHRLVAHLKIIHNCAEQLLNGFEQIFPTISIDHKVVLTGASLHDIGKVIHPEELSSPGSLHEEAGYHLLKKHGFPETICRIAVSHGQWAEMEVIGLEDLIVALADTIWKGCRNEKLEIVVVEQIASTSGLEPWEVFDKLDGLLMKIASDGEARLAAQAKFSQ